MNSAEIIRAVYQGVTFVNLALVVVACNNGSGSREGGNGRDAHAPPLMSSSPLKHQKKFMNRHKKSDPLLSSSNSLS